MSGGAATTARPAGATRSGPAGVKTGEWAASAGAPGASEQLSRVYCDATVGRDHVTRYWEACKGRQLRMPIEAF